MYDFLDYMIGRGQQNQATSELKDALIGLKKLESSLPNNTPPSTPSPNNTPTSPNNQNTPPSTPSTPNANNPSNTNSTPPTKPSTQANATKDSTQASTTKSNADNPTATKANDFTPPKQSDQANADNATQNISKSADNAINPPPTAEGDKGGGLFDLSSQTQNQTPKTTLETQYFQRENLKREIDELEKGYFRQRATADGSILPPKIDVLSESKRQKLDYERNELIQKAKALTNEIMQNHKILKTLKELSADEQISEAVLRNLINPNQTETPAKVIYKDFTKSGDEAMFINKQRALEYHNRAVKETKNNTLLRVARKKLEKAFNIEPIKEFGTNYAEFYQDGKGAISKLIAEANAAKQAGQDFSGQVAGAFSKEIDGAPARIDLVWGNEKMGLEKIIQKHLDDFGDFSGGNPQEKLANGLSEIITRGEVIEKDGVKTIWLKENDKNFVAGLSKGWKGNGENLWVITSYEKKNVGEGKTLSAYAEFNDLKTPKPTDNEIIPQTNIRESLNDTLKTAYDIFKAHNKDEANDKLFDRVVEVASKLDVRYWEQVNPKWVNGTYTFWLNRAMVDTKLLKADPERASQTILHELIHGVTSRAIYAYDNGLHELLSKTQIEGITELKNLYNEVRKNNASKAWIKYENSKEEALLNKNKIYGLSNEHEFLAELANKSFRDFLKEQNLFARIINAVAKIFGYTKKTGDEISTNAYNEAQEVLYKIMDNHKESFTRDFDDYYKKLDFMDLDNYKKYLKKHSERVKTHKDSIYLTTLAKAGVNSKNLIIGNGVYRQTLGVNHYSELENTPLTKILKDIIEGERVKVSTGYRGLMLDDKNTQHFIENLTILKGLSPFFTSGLYKKVDENYARYLLENLKNIGNRRITYRNNIFNTFFAKEFADREIEKLTKGDLYSLGIIDDNFLTKDKKMASNILQDDKINYAYLKEIATPLKKIDNQKEFLDAFAFKNNKTIGNVKTPIKEVEIDLKEAWEHLLKNSKQENRLKLAGGILPTLQEPNIISVDKNRTYYFYKAFSDEKGVLNLVSIELPKSNRLKYKTSYIASKQRLLKVFNEYEIVYENLQKARPPTA